MARTPRTSRTAAKPAGGIRLDLSKVSKAFEAGKEYAVVVAECTLEDGAKAPYFNFKLNGVEDDYTSSVMYHKASTSESSLWRLRPLMEAFGMEIPDGPMDIKASDFVGLQAMCTTYLDRYDGGSSVRPEDFFPMDEADGGSAEEFDLEELTDDQIDQLAEAMEVKGRTTAAKKKALAKLDLDELAEAFAGLEGSEEEEEEAPAKPLTRAQKRAAAKADEEADEKPPARGSRRAAKATPKAKEGVTEDELNEMNEDELEDLVDQNDLGIDLTEFKTLRKKRNAVLDALEEADLLAD